MVDVGYTVVRYISLEQLVADSADAYYDALLASTHDWHDDAADAWPWLTYLVGLLAEAYRRFAGRASTERSSGTKQDRVRDYVLRMAPGEFRLADIRSALPGVSDPTIRLVLQQLRRDGVVALDAGGGRSATWHRITAPS